MISTHTCSVLKEDDFPKLLHSDPRCSQACCQRSQMPPGAPKVLSGAQRCSQTSHNHCRGTSVPVIGNPSYCDGRQECPPRVWDSPEIDASKFALHILSDSRGGFQWQNYILLMDLFSEDEGVEFWPWIVEATEILPWEKSLTPAGSETRHLAGGSW